MNLLQNISTHKTRKKLLSVFLQLIQLRNALGCQGQTVSLYARISMYASNYVYLSILICKLVCILHQYECNASLRRRYTINGKSDHAANNILNFEDSNMLSKSLSGISWNRLTAFLQLIQKLYLLIKIQNVNKYFNIRSKTRQMPIPVIKEEKLKDNIKLIDANYATSYNKAEYIPDFKQISNMEYV